MSGQKVKPKATAAAESRKATSYAMQSRHRMSQNYLVIWVNGNIDSNNEECQNTLEQSRAVVREVIIFTTSAQCIQYLKGMGDEKAFIISSGALGQNLVDEIHTMTQVDVIYIFCGDKACREQ
ncbi:unnamed protein product [Rotaria socialis]|uniref:Uncharacterized protein n=1 Tax=Rotaria socialis TaxID=392032 RepID=A0A818WHH3_9BILA|nr:unnamed protein product [Rotaria socialis]CAF3379295.1 unnamed protein product [Rotaria socialis]CAF3432352.1 unnamed protein product [Rotaria socialis]CAF3437839.1 unnamed protein product [Rotaria socialis]CAF3724069.1 unnamed protein product [Rotaria socialis]